jgi:hypothetical protein
MKLPRWKFLHLVAGAGGLPALSRVAKASAMRVQVESVADYRGVETPRRFQLDGRKVEIVESDDQWYGADYRYFKVKGDDGNVYILRLDEPSREWELTMFQSRPQFDAPPS